MAQPLSEVMTAQAHAAHPGAAPPPGPSDHADSEHAHSPFLQHHFDTPLQQFEAGKLGIWIFLVTEVLFFSGLFCAYAIYRAQHPEIFQFAHYYLDTKLGATNTVVLLLSSLTAAWAVRAAQLGQQRTLKVLIGITLLCAGVFLGIKYVEYSHKAHDGLLWGKLFAPKHQVWDVESFRSRHPEAARLAERLHLASSANHSAAKPAAPSGSAGMAGTEGPIARALAAERPSTEALEPLVQAGVLPKVPATATSVGAPPNAHVFFGIYFFMTGLHGVHVIAGILLWGWILKRALQRHFGPRYYGPVDYVALYWHLVDLIWIYLFPLLYLIH